MRSYLTESCTYMPSSLAVSVCSIAVPCISSLISVPFVGLKVVKVVFVGFGTRLLSWKYRMRSVRSDWAFACRFFTFSAVTISVVSSAYVYTFDWTVLMILLMYSRKSVVDSVLPWGMPCVITCMSDCACVVC